MLYLYNPYFSPSQEQIQRYRQIELGIYDWENMEEYEEWLRWRNARDSESRYVDGAEAYGQDLYGSESGSDYEYEYGVESENKDEDEVEYESEDEDEDEDEDPELDIIELSKPLNPRADEFIPQNSR